MSFHVRPATPADARQLAALAGPKVSTTELGNWIGQDRNGAAWHLVEDQDGTVLGFQRIGPGDHLPDDACEIATFLGPDPLPPGAAAALFDTTAETARRLRFAWISARVATRNEAARIYYQIRGFRLYSSDFAHMRMRFDLD